MVTLRLLSSPISRWTIEKNAGDAFYQLGCSTTAVATEKETALGSGKQGVSYCNKDYCNSSTTTGPAIALILAMAMAIITR